MVLKMEDALGKLETVKKTGISEKRFAVGSVSKQALKLVKMPTVSGVPQAKAAFDNPLGTRFTIFAMAFNGIGLATLTFGGVSIGGNIVAAEVVLGSSLVCLSAYLFRSIIGNRRKNN